MTAFRLSSHATNFVMSRELSCHDSNSYILRKNKSILQDVEAFSTYNLLQEWTISLPLVGRSTLAIQILNIVQIIKYAQCSVLYSFSGQTKSSKYM